MSNEEVYLKETEHFKNASKYTLKTTKKYLVLYQVDNIIIYLSVAPQDEAIINNMLNKLGC